MQLQLPEHPHHEKAIVDQEILLGNDGLPWITKHWLILCIISIVENSFDEPVEHVRGTNDI